MGGRKLVLTLIGRGQATVGNTFKLHSVPRECYGCRLFDVCISRVRPGRIYRIVEVRKIGLPRLDRCLLTGEEMIPIVAEELPILVPLPSRSAVEGIVTTYTKPPGDCEDIKVHIPDESTLKDGTRIMVLRILRNSKCSSGAYSIVEAIPLD